MIMKLLGVLAIIGSAALGTACCGFGAPGTSVRFVGQTNIVIWDRTRGIEHFVRDAQFSSGGKDLGFVAPTPSKPTLSEASAMAFQTLESLDPKLAERALKGAFKSATLIPTAAVSVIEEKDVAGYHATVLKATDGKALGDWLASNGYAKPEFFDGWVKPYLDRGWYLTAFKVKGGGQTATGPVRMSFETDRPFNPYSVPEENGDGSASLRLFYVSAGHEVPKIGGTAGWRSPEWSTPLSPETANTLAGQLKLPVDAIPENSTVTTYVDREFGQPGLDDLYFVDQSNSNAAGGLGLAAILAVVAMRTRRRPQAG
jgi:hypothetical protein